MKNKSTAALHLADKTLSVVHDRIYLALPGCRSGEAISKTVALELLELEAQRRSSSTVERLKKSKTAEEIEFVLAVNFSYLRRILRFKQELEKLP